MAMTYTELKTNVQDITEMSFTDAQLSMFTKQAEQKIYGFIKDLPILSKTTPYNSIAPTALLSLEADCIYVHDVVQTGLSTGESFLMQKDLQLLREADPATSKAAPASAANQPLTYYAITSDATTNQEASRLTLALYPKWDTTVSLIVRYQYQPRSIVDTDGGEESPWLGTNYDSALLNAVLVEAARFMKAEPDIIQLYDQQFVLAIQPLAETVNVRLQSDSYRPKTAPAQPLTVPAPPQPRQAQER